MGDTLSNVPNIEPDSERGMNRRLLLITLWSMFLVTAPFLFAPPNVDSYPRSRHWPYTESPDVALHVHSELSGLFVTNETNLPLNHCVFSIYTVDGRYNRIETLSPNGAIDLPYDSFERVDRLRLDRLKGFFRTRPGMLDIHCEGGAVKYDWSGGPPMF